MDKTTKFILGLIAVALIGINIQMWNGKTGLIKPAYAKKEKPCGERLDPCFVWVKNYDLFNFKEKFDIRDKYSKEDWEKLKVE